MATLGYTNNPAQYPDVYQLEQTDPVDAGVGGNGVSNLQAKQLTERTDYLKNTIEAGGGAVVQTNTGSTLTVADVNKKYVVGAGSQTFIMPLANTCKSGAVIEFVARVGSVTVERQGSDTLLKDTSETSITVADNQFIKFSCNGSNSWIVIARGFIEDYVPPVAVGSVVMRASSAVPSGYLECNGAAVSRTTYADLFAIIGTTYGSGNGTTTFNIPDLRGEFVRGWDNGRGVDTGRDIGTSQSGTGIASSHGTNGENLFVNADGTTGTPTSYISSVGSPNLGDAYNLTRPRNVALMYIIKF